MSNLSKTLKKGTKVKIKAKDYVGQIGTVKYVGPIVGKQAEGDYIGLELEKDNGKNNGTFGGKRYFQAKPNYGVFMKPSSITLMDGTPVVPGGTASTSKISSTSNKLSKDLGQASTEGTEIKKTEKTQKVQKGEKTEKVEKSEKVQIQAKQEKQQKQTPSEASSKLQIEELKKKIKVLEEENRNIKIESEKVKYSVKQQDSGKEKQLQDQINFFKTQKQANEKQKADLKKKITELNEELELGAESLQMIENLTYQKQNLQGKIQKLKQQLQASNSQLKNLKMSNTSSASSQELNQNLKVLNEMVTMLESDNKTLEEKVIELSQQIKRKQVGQGQVKKLERKLKQKQEQLQMMANELDLLQDSANFAEKLTIDMLKKQQNLKETTLKLNEYIQKVEALEGELSQNKQINEAYTQQVLEQQDLMDQYSVQIEQKNKHIAELNRQIEKYKKKLFEFSQSTSDPSLISQLSEQKEQTVAVPSSIFPDQYQSKYYSLLKQTNASNKVTLKSTLGYTQIKNHIGIYILNLFESLPESFTSKLYPDILSIVTLIKSTTDKLYYIFTTVCDVFMNKGDVYGKDSEGIVGWYLLLLNEIALIFGCLYKIELAFLTAENKEQIEQILDHKILRQQIRKVNFFAHELLEKFIDDNVNPEIDLEIFVNSILTFDEINISLKRSFSIEHETKLRLCTETMQTITGILSMIVKFKHTNQLKQNGEVDNTLQVFMKSLLEYLKQCNLNPYIRYKSDMKKYLDGMILINQVMSDIDSEGNYNELSSLYSQAENIKMLRDTIITVQYLVNVLENDLKEIVYVSEVSKIQVQLSGKFWQQKIKNIKEELTRVKQIQDQKEELSITLQELKVKNALLQRDIKDKQNIKEVYEKRIGELQLKVEQTTSIENQNKRLAEKIKSYEDAHKSLDEDIVKLRENCKTLEQKNYELQKKYDQKMKEIMESKKDRTALSSDDVANLSIFKNAIKQNNQLRTFDLHKKMIQLKQSPIFMLSSIVKQKEKEKTQLRTQAHAVRIKAYDQISQFKVNDPFSSTKNSNIAQLDDILMEIEKIGGKRDVANEEKVKEWKVGSLSIGGIQGVKASVSGASCALVLN